MKDQLLLTIKKQHFDKIISGEKKEEYRERKSYWCNRLKKSWCLYKKFKEVKFVNGYRKDSPFAIVEFLETISKKGSEINDKFCNNNKNYYVIKLGKIIKVGNIKKGI